MSTAAPAATAHRDADPRRPGSPPGDRAACDVPLG